MELLERESELAAVEGLLERGGVLIVEGGAGIGKTSLLEEACRRAEGLGREVLHARGSVLEADFAFGAVRQVFERRLAEAPAGVLRPAPDVRHGRSRAPIVPPAIAEPREPRAT